MSKITGIKVGTTYISSTYTDVAEVESNSVEFTVTAVSLGFISTPEDTTYTGSAFYPVPIVTAIVNGESVTLEQGTDYDLSYSDNINVGEATVTATGKGNFTGSVSSHWNIQPADMTVIADDQSYTYDGTRHGTGVTVTTIGENNATIRYRTTSSGSYNLTSPPQFRDVVNPGFNGTVYFQVTVPNHDTYEGTYQLIIYPREVVLSWGTLSWIYDGLEHHTTCTVSNLVSGDTCTVTLYNNSITNIGTITVTARASEALNNSNYVLSQDESRTLTVSGGMYVRLSGTWTPVKEVYKRVSGNWVKQSMAEAFSVSEAYVKMD